MKNIVKTTKLGLACALLSCIISACNNGGGNNATTSNTSLAHTNVSKSTASSSLSEYLYVVNNQDNDIGVYMKNTADGSLGFIESLPAPANPFGIAANSNTKMIYIAGSESNDIATYDENYTYKDYKIVIPTGDEISCIVLSPDNQYLFVATGHEVTGHGDVIGNILKFKLNSDGSIPNSPQSKIVTDNEFYGMTFTPDRTQVFFTDGYDNIYEVYKYESATGNLIYLSTSSTGHEEEPIGITFSGYAYIVNIADIDIYLVGANNSLIYQNSVENDNLPWGIVFDNANTYAYVTNTSNNSITTYSREYGGQLTPSSKTTSTGNFPTDLAMANFLVKPRAKFVYVTDFTGNSIWTYSVNNGVLTQIPESTPTEVNPTKLTINPKNVMGYLTAWGSNTNDDYTNFYAYMIQSGLLSSDTQVGQGYFSREASDIVFSADGKTAYISSYEDGIIYTVGVEEDGNFNEAGFYSNNYFWIPTPTGVLSTNNGLYVTNYSSNEIIFCTYDNVNNCDPGMVVAKLPKVSGPNAIAINIYNTNSSKVYVYATNDTANYISIFSINADNTLTWESSPVLGYQAQGVTVDPNGQYIYVTDSTNRRIVTYAINGNSISTTPYSVVATRASSPKGISIFDYNQK